MTKWRNSKSALIRERLAENPSIPNCVLVDELGVSSPLVSKIKSEMRVSPEVPKQQHVRNTAALARGLTTMQLDNKLLKVIYRDDLVDAILDDGQ